MENLLPKIWELLTIYGIKIIAALAIIIFGRWAAKIVEKVIHNIMERRRIDPTITTFASNLTYTALLIFIILAALSQIGIQTTSFIAVLGAAGLAIGLALQGSLSNFAAGFLLLLFRPFRVSDFIEAAGVAGTVEKIQIFTTQLTTPDNKTIIIPNHKLTEDNIVNWSTKGTRRVDLVFGISYQDNIDNAKKIIIDTLADDDRILKNPPPIVALSELADSSVNFIVRPWVKADDYWNVYFSVTENIKKEFDAQGISIPFPQRDVHIYEHKAK
ncbi:MAG: mechanosensitive ion channel [Desulfobacterales bacterium]|jgi:small conductance mechanosensitive channel|nr:mechanosensitive ion channel [Desulfobacterales bacterium]